jgi:hypothetical protein
MVLALRGAYLEAIIPQTDIRREANKYLERHLRFGMIGSSAAEPDGKCRVQGQVGI